MISLKSIQLNFAGCYQITDGALLSLKEGLEILKGLERIDFRFFGCDTSKDFNFKILQELKTRLSDARIDFS